MGVAYSADLLDHYRHPRHRGPVAGAGHVGRVVNPLCGDEVTMRARVEGARIEAVGFDGVGCAISLGAADIVAQEAIGQTAATVGGWDEHWLHERIGMVPPPGRRRCAALALEAIQRALVDNHPPQGK